ncbi:Competence protein ComM [Frondihabitans sp. 762G35]|uniref:YifB family Mg chelatase-like AAA ATPase n=1 Tax=Frondihabitans sp. 762G35 TaxID=1446794 RepID=UPI000D21793A|nr:YifB family Mg chelatase-like AAA ATPase [Frondihabitans sp. 762G35]ARC57296.1 Competence protein ComM [Frondihabitans sp. 762G35]
MSVARTRVVTLLGLTGSVVEIEADISDGLPGFVLIGLPDASLGEARDRVRAAASNSGCPLPPRKLTVNLSPASVPKHGSSFDLGIAVAALAAADLVESASVERVVHLGELGLDGRLRPITGVLPAVLGAAHSGAGIVMVPSANVDEASLVPDIRVVGVASLREAAIWHGGAFEPVPVDPLGLAHPSRDASVVPELSDVIGNPVAVKALIAAASGGHHLLMVGPPGAGKSMLAARLPGLLPDLDVDSALEVSSIRSLCGQPVAGDLERRPPFESPHHSCSAASLVGGGSAVLRPGAASRASRGVLFLDEAPEFAPAVLDCLRQPLESGEIQVHRSRAVAVFPARFQLVLAANPCPCGQFGSRDLACTCSPHDRRRYLGRLSGPLVDRIDMQLRVGRIASAQFRLAADPETRTISTAAARERVLAARERARHRLRETPWRLNSEVTGMFLRSEAVRPPLGVTAAIDRALESGALTMRGYDRVLRVAWTLADLDEADRPTADHVASALALRRSL